MANDVFSSAPTLCMNDFSSASPKVIAPRQSSDTFAPDAPSFLYFMIWSRPFEPRGSVAFQPRRACGAEAYTPPAGPHVERPPFAKASEVGQGLPRREQARCRQVGRHQDLSSAGAKRTSDMTGPSPTPAWRRLKRSHLSGSKISNVWPGRR